MGVLVQVPCRLVTTISRRQTRSRRNEARAEAWVATIRQPDSVAVGMTKEKGRPERAPPRHRPSVRRPPPSASLIIAAVRTPTDESQALSTGTAPPLVSGMTLGRAVGAGNALRRAQRKGDEPHGARQVRARTCDCRPYLAEACAEDWGLSHDITKNLQVVLDWLGDYGLSEKETTRVYGRVMAAVEANEDEEKSRRWQRCAPGHACGVAARGRGCGRDACRSGAGLRPAAPAGVASAQKPGPRCTIASGYRRPSTVSGRSPSNWLRSRSGSIAPCSIRLQ